MTILHGPTASEALSAFLTGILAASAALEPQSLPVPPEPAHDAGTARTGNSGRGGAS